MADIRNQIIACARRHVDARTPYQWGGGHHGPGFGLDCSGLVLDCLRSVGKDPGAWDSAMMREQLPKTDSPQPGDVALYLPRHVVLVETFDPKTGIASIIGANGGDSSTTSPERAAQQDARVKWEPTHLYRETFVGFRSIAPWGIPDWSGPEGEGSNWVPTVLIIGILGALGAYVWSAWPQQ